MSMKAKRVWMIYFSGWYKRSPIFSSRVYLFVNLQQTLHRVGLEKCVVHREWQFLNVTCIETNIELVEK